MIEHAVNQIHRYKEANPHLRAESFCLELTSGQQPLSEETWHIVCVSSAAFEAHVARGRRLVPCRGYLVELDCNSSRVRRGLSLCWCGRPTVEAHHFSELGHIETVKPHFDVVHAQLRQIRDALAIAVALGRALIVPELLCPLDRVWFAHTGVFPGSALQLPFACPLDHVLEVDVLQRTSLPADTFGPPIDFRESTFLDAAAMKPHWVTRTDVVVCDPSSDSQCDPDDASVGSSVRAPSNLTAAGWRALQAARFANAKVVHLPSVPPACFGGFDDPAIERGFTERLKMSGGPWGQTVRTSGPGHIWYDLFWYAAVRLCSARGSCRFLRSRGTAPPPRPPRQGPRAVHGPVRALARRALGAGCG